MANIFIQDPIYISEVDLKESSNNIDIQENLESDDLKELITKAEDIIDMVIWDFWVAEVEWQTRIFPTSELWLPIDIVKATVLLCDNLYAGGILDWNAYDNTSGNWSVKSETYRGHTVSYYWDSNELVKKNEFLDEQILIYLKPYLLSLDSKWYR